MYTEGEPPAGRPRDRRAVGIAFLAGALISAVVTAVIVDGGNSPKQVIASAGASTTVAAPTPSSSTLASVATPVPTAVVPSSIPVTSTSLSPATSPPATAARVSATTTPSGPVISGTVADTAGHPVPGAYVIGLQTLTVVRTDSAGRYSMPCAVTANGIAGTRAEPLVAAPWLLPVQPTGQGSYAYGGNTTGYGPPPSTPGLGYAFSGGAPDAASATVVTCNGHPANFTLPAGGGADIQFVGAGAANGGNPAPGPGPVDNLYLPGLGQHAALETDPLTADGRQVVTQLGPGILRLDGVSGTVNCSGAGVSSDPSVAGADITITPGKTVAVTCQ